MPEKGSVAHILAEKISAEGPVALSEYMGISNAAYYAAKDPLGEKGDFITAPEISQMFGELIGIWLSDLWLRKDRPKNVHYVELGPGRGTLASDALRTMDRFGYNPDIHFVETSPVLKTKQAALHPGATWHDNIADLPTNGPLMIVANEFFDALPIEQFTVTDKGLQRHLVGWKQGKFIPLTDKQAAKDRVSQATGGLPEGAILETSPASGALMEQLSGRVAEQGGVILIIDYGYDHPGTGSTLQALKNHKPVDPYESPGKADLTAHVNFHSLANIARTRLLSVHGPADQGQWLKALGIDQRMAKLAQNSPDKADMIRAAHHRLTSADEMGRLFRVMAASAMEWPEPEGFASDEG
ncbi:SAM-dependent methyltransferase [Parasphingorhabdus sp. JC815]|uniref:class I SAM-dependent methyltransferase n=1 Tax=Parasphingorhabdus sp. JC815 TaxID=3232140 RepID=UPI00345AF814